MIAAIAAIPAAYIVTVVITGASILTKPRDRFIEATPWLQPDPEHPHFAECRLCVGFWVSIIVTIAAGLGFWGFFIVYGASYFLATQER